ncbi:hypothetical protein BCR44DRAFT_407103 [Catenaria anguillulae PL171]|uniref:Uncharacterized protein n=1 Tax=Catenaria anguillulae PL171 TaxID=765915 RepID=A0A1Y2HRG2_9FUNG|nr:hypothetical protein BCR44DRAFT_407103 [Catenaria anguillulae PL171]
MRLRRPIQASPIMPNPALANTVPNFLWLVNPHPPVHGTDASPNRHAPRLEGSVVGLKLRNVARDLDVGRGCNSILVSGRDSGTGCNSNLVDGARVDVVAARVLGLSGLLVGHGGGRVAALGFADRCIGFVVVGGRDGDSSSGNHLMEMHAAVRFGHWDVGAIVLARFGSARFGRGRGLCGGWCQCRLSLNVVAALLAPASGDQVPRTRAHLTAP